MATTTKVIKETKLNHAQLTTKYVLGNEGVVEVTIGNVYDIFYSYKM